MNGFLLMLFTIVCVVTLSVLVYPLALAMVGKLIQLSQREYMKRGRE